MKKMACLALVFASILGCKSKETIKREESKTIVKTSSEMVPKEKKIDKEAVEEVKIEVKKDNPAMVAQKFFNYGAAGDIEGLKKVSYWNHPEEISKDEVGEHYVQEVIVNFEKNPRMKNAYQDIKKKKLKLSNPVYYSFNEQRAVALLSQTKLFVYLGKFDEEWKVLAWNDNFYSGPVRDEAELLQIYKKLIQEAMDKNPDVEFTSGLTSVLAR